MIPFVENKAICWETVKSLLSLSERQNQWTNFGPVSILLEDTLATMLHLSPEQAVTVCSSGTSALHALVYLHHQQAGKKLLWGVPDFTFASSFVGVLGDCCRVLDVDSSGHLSPDQDCDGLIVTDLYGAAKISKYRKPLIVDSAIAFDRKREICVNEALSFHHTKPWGFGEGGAIITDRSNKKLVESIINFGQSDKSPSCIPYCTNSKISDVSCAFILQRLMHWQEISATYQEQYCRIVELADKCGYDYFVSNCTSGCVALIADKPIYNLQNDHIVLKKYYKPLRGMEMSSRHYSRAVNFPCHPGVGSLSDKVIKDVLCNLS